MWVEERTTRPNYRYEGDGKPFEQPRTGAPPVWCGHTGGPGLEGRFDLDLGAGDVSRLDRGLELLVLTLEVAQARLGRLDRFLERLELLHLLPRGKGEGGSLVSVPVQAISSAEGEGVVMDLSTPGRARMELTASRT